jgi:hypothetical protein
MTFAFLDSFTIILKEAERGSHFGTMDTRMKKHKRPASAKPVTVKVALAWYDAIQWAKLKQIADDAMELDDSYEDWQHGIQTVEHQLREKGVDIQRVPIDVDSLVAWCKLRMIPVNAESRSRFAAEIASGQARS